LTDVCVFFLTFLFLLHADFFSLLFPRRLYTRSQLVAKEYGITTEGEVITKPRRGRKSAAATNGEGGAGKKRGAAAVDAVSEASGSRATTPAAGPAPKKAKR
jgi:hypothetical protein